ncbi:MAG TPA: mechanosensitive ion channel family protein [Stellaceae bacterium]|nr:mechanosensitive ion channel family protein [Stellaceae bacterium]
MRSNRGSRTVGTSSSRRSPPPCSLAVWLDAVHGLPLFDALSSRASSGTVSGAIAPQASDDAGDTMTVGLLMEAPLLLASICAAFGLALIPWVLRQPTRTRIGFGVVYLGVYTYLLTRAEVLPSRPAASALPFETRILAQALQVFWWFVLARWLIALGRVFLLFKHKLGERKFATDLLSGLVYLVVFLAAINFVFDLPITGLIATSGAVAIILGLALQSTASDLFSGIALNVEGAYRIGDWIGLEGNVEGTVKEITWRATHIVTWAQDTVIVPNSVIAKSRIINYSFPARVHGVTLTVSLEDRMPPAPAIEMLELAVLNCGLALRRPPPSVQATGVGAGSVDYAISFFVESIDQAGQATSDLLAAIHRHAAWSGVALARKRQDLSVVSDVRTPEVGPAPTIVDRFPLFQSLPDAEKQALLAKLKRRELRGDEIVFEQGQPSQSAFLIESGIVSVSRNDLDGSAVEVARLGPGQYMGEEVVHGALRHWTARALTHAVLYEVPASEASSFLKSHPELEREVENALPRDLRSSAAPPVPGPGASRKTPLGELLARIGKFLPR